MTVTTKTSSMDHFPRISSDARDLWRSALLVPRNQMTEERDELDGRECDGEAEDQPGESMFPFW